MSILQRSMSAPHLGTMTQSSNLPTFLTTLPERAVIAITGPEAGSFLQRVITNGPENLTEGQAQFSALLTPQGKVLADFLIFDDGENGLLIDVPASEAAALVKRFMLYRMRAEAEINLREDLAVIAAKGEGEAELQTVALSASPDPRSSELGLRAIAPAGGPSTEIEAYHIARIGAGVAEFGSDYGPSEVFSTDVNHDRLSGIDYKKGCFVGQEVASRMHRKGGVRKRTLRLHVETGTLPKGCELMADETALGAVTSSAGQFALARVRIDRLQSALDDGVTLSVDGVPVQVLDDLSTF